MMARFDDPLLTHRLALCANLAHIQGSKQNIRRVQRRIGRGWKGAQLDMVRSLDGAEFVVRFIANQRTTSKHAAISLLPSCAPSLGRRNEIAIALGICPMKSEIRPNVAFSQNRFEYSQYLPIDAVPSMSSSSIGLLTGSEKNFMMTLNDFCVCQPLPREGPKPLRSSRPLRPLFWWVSGAQTGKRQTDSESSSEELRALLYVLQILFWNQMSSRFCMFHAPPHGSTHQASQHRCCRARHDWRFLRGP